MLLSLVNFRISCLASLFVSNVGLLGNQFLGFLYGQNLTINLSLLLLVLIVLLGSEVHGLLERTVLHSHVLLQLFEQRFEFLALSLEGDDGVVFQSLLLLLISNFLFGLFLLG